MRATVNAPFYFETRFSNEQVKERRHPHYGRFLKLKPRKQIVMTWVTGPEGTAGAETVLTVALRPDGKGTELMLTHAGFIGEKSLKQHEEAWPQVLENLDEVLSKSGKR